MPSTYNGWTVVTAPSSPAPQSIEFTTTDIVGVNTSPFTGEQQIQDWQAHWLEASVTMPPMSSAQAQAWVNFFIALKGQACVFQFGDPVTPMLIPAAASATGYWRLKTNSRKRSVNEGMIYGFQFEIREAK